MQISHYPESHSRGSSNNTKPQKLRRRSKSTALRHHHMKTPRRQRRNEVVGLISYFLSNPARIVNYQSRPRKQGNFDGRFCTPKPLISFQCLRSCLLKRENPQIIDGTHFVICSNFSALMIRSTNAYLCQALLRDNTYTCSQVTGRRAWNPVQASKLSHCRPCSQKTPTIVSNLIASIDLALLQH